jgi:predicted nucleic acid-binding protein
MDVERRLVVDANILIRAVLGPRARTIIFDNADRTAFFAPEVAYADARKYLPALAAKRGHAPESVAQTLEVLDAFESVVLAVAQGTYEVARADAEARLEGRDLADWPILATAMVLDCPIWTEDQDFFGTGVPTWTTDRVELYLNNTN